jgi:DNA-binding response OmpR family regulator
MSASRILVVDDDPDVRDLVRELLERAGHSVRTAAEGREALRLLYEVRPQLIVLDVAMPGLDGWATLQRVRDITDVPVLMLTARDGELEKVRGLKSGADDYVTKPFGRQELLARVEALLRRSGGSSAPQREAYDDGVIALDIANAHVTVCGTEVALTPLELRLLHVFVRHPDMVLSRNQLLELVWGTQHSVGPDQVKLYVGYLRRKLAPALDDVADPIQTVRGFGYRFRVPARV